MRDAERSPSRKQSVIWFACLLVLSSIVAYLNRHHVEQQTNYVTAYIDMAEHYKGHITRKLLTYPLWGYPFVLLLLPRYEYVVIPQIVLGAAAATAVLVRLTARLPQYRRALLLLFFLGIPWFLLHSVKWPQSFAASLIVLAIVQLDTAVGRRTWIGGAIAGGILGLALYFRSEFIYLPLFIVVCVVVLSIRQRHLHLPVRPFVAFAIVAMASLIPWAAHYYRETGHISFTTSQRGIVAFISLGQLPHNPWGLEYKDEYAVWYLRSRGIALPAQSDSADRVLFNEFKRRVRGHPMAFLEKTAWNGLMTFAGGFYSGDVHLSGEEEKELVALRSRVKSFLHLGDDPGGAAVAHIDGKVLFSLAFWVVAKGIGSLVSILTAIGIAVAVVRGLHSPLLVFLAAYIIYQFLLLLALATEPRYLNGLYLAMLPFVVIAVEPLWLIVGRWRPRPAARMEMMRATPGLPLSPHGGAE